MKLSLVLSLICTVAFSAGSFSQNISVNLENARVKDVFHSIEGQSAYRFFYNDELTDINRTVNLEVKDSKIEEVLNQLFVNTDISYTILENNLIVIAPKRAIQQQKVTGTVTDNSTGEAMPGVNVVIEGTTAGTITDSKGKFSIDISNENAILVFSFVGYLTEKVSVAGQANIDVKLSPDVTKLEEVVVVGYGTQKKSDVTGSVTSVSAKTLGEVPSANMQQALQGRGAGLEIQKVGTAPGASAQIRIRGERSVNGNNDPLIVLDGIPFEGGNLNDINPNDIASVDVLKDASATAIYGSRGSNGVIIISTKRGKAGVPKISLNCYYGINSVARKYKLFSPQEYMAMRDTAKAQGIYTGTYMADELASLDASGNVIRSTDWQKEMYKNGYVTNDNLSVSGGTDITQYSIGGDFYKETTVLPGQDFSRYSLRANVDTKIGKKIKVGLSTLNSYSINNGSQFVNPQTSVVNASNGLPFSGFANPTGLPSGNSGIMFPILSLSPLMPAYNADGTVNKTPAGNTTDQPNTYSPLLLKSNNNNWVDKMINFRSFNSVYGEYEIIEGLKYRLNAGLDYRHLESDQFQGKDSYFRPTIATSAASVNNGEAWGYTIENLLTLDRTFAEKHKINITALYSIQEDHTHTSYMSKVGLIDDFLQFYNLGVSDPAGSYSLSGSEQAWTLLSYMARINYIYDGKYMITLTGRRDGSSRLAKKWHEYPAVSLGWNISREAFMENIKPVSNLKLRAGWGQTSNQAVQPYSTLGGVSPTQTINGVSVFQRYNYGSTVVPGVSVNTVPDNELNWEYTKTTNIGLDFGILKDRITGSVDWYNAKTDRLLFSLQLPATTGIPGLYQTNIGETENKGMEFVLSSVNLKLNNGLTWSTDVNVFFNRNKLLKIDGVQTDNIANDLHVGYPLNAVYDYKKLGIWQTDEAAEAATFGQLPGQLKLEDHNGDGVINSADKYVIGSEEAKWQGGMTNRVSFKGFDFSIVAYARMGGLLISGLHQPSSGYLTMNNGLRNGLKVDYWTTENPTNWFPGIRNTLTPPNATGATSTLGYYDASFVKIRSISLGYTIPSKITQSLKIQSIRVYVTAQNPFLLYSPYVTKYNGVDPEATGTGTNGFVGGTGAGGGGIAARLLTISASTPPTRSFLFGINLNF